MKIYFAGSIRGGREKVEDYKKIISILSGYGEVLTEHIGDTSLSSLGEQTKTDKEIFERDISWIDEADVVVAEVTVASLGVGYELGYAEAHSKKIVCLYQNDDGKSLSAMVSGNKNLAVIYYKNIEDFKEKLADYLH